MIPTFESVTFDEVPINFITRLANAPPATNVIIRASLLFVVWVIL